MLRRAGGAAAPSAQRPVCCAGRSRVSTVTSADRPAISGRPGSPSIAIRTGTRWRDLDPIAARILRRQHRELRAGAGADAGDMAADVDARIGVELDLGGLADIHVGEVGLLVIGLDIGGRRCARG